MWLTALRSRRAARDSTSEILDAILSLDAHAEHQANRLDRIEGWIAHHDSPHQREWHREGGR